MPPAERILNEALATRAEGDLEFASYLLSRTRFAGAHAHVILARGNNPWHRSKLDGKESETDILLVYERLGSQERFAVHIENKQPCDRLRPGQAEGYKRRAIEWLRVPKWGAYTDFVTMLIAPAAFAEANAAEAGIFDAFLSYEELGERILLFQDSLRANLKAP